MPKSKIGPAIRKEDYEAFHQLSPDLPDTIGEWLAELLKLIAG
jgi:hypothetical protein